METIICGRAYVFGRNVDTDQICPGRYLELTDHREISRHCLEGARADFAQTFLPGGIVAAMENFGCGSSREHAAIALKTIGVGAVVAKSYARIFYRNGVNMGIPLIVARDIDRIAVEGASLKIDLENSLITNTGTDESVPCDPISEYPLSILEAGGIKNMLINQMKG